MDGSNVVVLFQMMMYYRNENVQLNLRLQELLRRVNTATEQVRFQRQHAERLQDRLTALEVILSHLTNPAEPEDDDEEIDEEELRAVEEELNERRMRQMEDTWNYLFENM